MNRSQSYIKTKLCINTRSAINHTKRLPLFLFDESIFEQNQTQTQTYLGQVVCLFVSDKSDGGGGGGDNSAGIDYLSPVIPSLV